MAKTILKPNGAEGLQVLVALDFRYEEYRRACEKASIEAVRKAATILQREVRRNARAWRSRKHRDKRTYRAGGPVYVEPKHLDQVVRRRSGTIKRGRRTGNPYGLVFFEYGYGVFANYGTKRGHVQQGRFHLQRALATKQGALISALKQEWPK